MATICWQSSRTIFITKQELYSRVKKYYFITHPSNKLLGMSYALKLGNIDLKNIPIALELLVADLGLLGLEYILIESNGGSGSKLKTSPLKSCKKRVVILMLC